MNKSHSIVAKIWLDPTPILTRFDIASACTVTKTEQCEELAKQLRAKWEKRTTLINSRSEEFHRVDEEVTRLVNLVQEACGDDAQEIITEIWKNRV